MMRSWKGVRGGTPLHGKSLCDSCSYARIIRGEALSETLTTCEAMYNKPIDVPFRIVTECSMHLPRNTPSLYQMQKIAYIMKTDPKGKPIGFMSNNEFRKEKELESSENLTEGYVP